MNWFFRLRLWLAYKLLPHGHTIGSILHLNLARQSLTAATRFIERSGHLTNKYKAGKRLRGDLTAAADALGESELARKEAPTPPAAS